MKPPDWVTWKSPIGDIDKVVSIGLGSTKPTMKRNSIGKLSLTQISFAAVFCLGSIGIARAASPAWLTAHDDAIKVLVSKMTLAEKAGQMTQPDLGALKDYGDVETLCLGSVLSGGTSDPKAGNTLQAWSELSRELQQRALKTRLGIPLLYGVDAVHGHNNVLQAVIFPHNIGLGCSRDPKLVELAAAITAREVRATGIQWTFAPCVAVPRDIRWGRTYEGFSEDPEVVRVLGLAAVRGLQGKDLSQPEHVLACAKHFVGDGGTAFRSTVGEGLLDQGDVRVREEVLRKIHLTGYPAAIDAGVGTIMPSYSSWNGVKCSGNRWLLTDLLKKELGFEGFLISDYNAIDQLVAEQKPDAALPSANASGQVRAADYKRCIEISINAGMDMVMVTDKYRDFITLLQQLVQEGRIPMARVDDAVTRILRVKFAMGMMKPGVPATLPEPTFQQEFGSAEHRRVARQAVAQSLVWLKNDRRVLPLSLQAKRVHLAGRGADNLGMQCGGWTIDWQGGMGSITPGGTTILQGMRAALGDGKVSYDRDGNQAAGADVAVVVIGEEPYAEMKGDRESLAVHPDDAQVVARVKATGVPLVVVVLSGRPLILGSIVEQADAIVAAWLPGTEGTGVADVLVGAVKPTGKLSFAWPRTMAQVPRGHDDAASPDALYPLGFGLTE